MYPLKKGKTTNQAHVGLPEGTFEEEHGRKGFYGKSAHLYHAHPPTGWIRFEGKLRPHCFDLNQLKPGDLNDAEGLPAAFLGNDDIRFPYRAAAIPCRFTSAMPMATSCTFVHRGRGKIETDFGPLDFEPGDYINIPRAVTYRIVPETRDNFFLIIQSKHEFEQPEKGLLGPARAIRSGGHHHARAGAESRTTIANGKSASRRRTRFRKWSIRSIPSTWSAGRAI